MSVSECLSAYMLNYFKVENQISNELHTIISRLPESEWLDEYIIGEGDYKTLDIDGWVNDLTDNTDYDVECNSSSLEYNIISDWSVYAEDFVSEQVNKLRP